VSILGRVEKDRIAVLSGFGAGLVSSGSAEAPGSRLCIREYYFDHSQSVESTDKRQEVHGSALLEVKCPLHGSEMAISTRSLQGK